jgi:hypothetical protein
MRVGEPQGDLWRIAADGRQPHTTGLLHRVQTLQCFVTKCPGKASLRGLHGDWSLTMAAL